MMNDYTPISAEKQYQENAQKALKKMREYESSTILHKAQVNQNTIIACKNEDRINEYKKLLKQKR